MKKWQIKLLPTQKLPHLKGVTSKNKRVRPTDLKNDGSGGALNWCLHLRIQSCRVILQFRSCATLQYLMFLIQSLTDCKWPICMKEISIFDLSVFWMKSLSTEVMAIMLIAIDATPWLPNNNRWYAAHIITFTCCSPHRLVSAVTPGLSGSGLAICTVGVWVGRGRRGQVSAGCYRSSGSVDALSRRIPLFPISPSSFFFPVRWIAYKQTQTVCASSFCVAASCTSLKACRGLEVGK